jgi:hypothetical protein
MSYVPDVRYDVFISYAHDSNKAAASRGGRGWVSELWEVLNQRLVAEMAPSPTVFMDDSSLRKAGAYPEDLEKALRQSGLLLTINCEPYFFADWCVWELEKFRDQCGNDDPRTKDGGRRIVEVYKSLRPNGSAPKIQQGNNGIWFCTQPVKGDHLELDHPSHTFERGSEEYELAVRTLVDEIKKLLVTLRSASKTIFMSRPIDYAMDPNSSLTRLYKNLRNDLQRKYQVVPPPAVEPSDKDLVESTVSVHFLSQKYDELTYKNIESARLAGKRLFVIVPHALQSDTPVGEYLKSLEQVIDATLATSESAALRVFRYNEAKHNVSDIVSEIRALIPVVVPPGLGKLSLYMIFDAKDNDEEEVDKLLKVIDKFKTFDANGSLSLSETTIAQVYNLFLSMRHSHKTLNDNDVRRLIGDAHDLHLDPTQLSGVPSAFSTMLEISEVLESGLSDTRRPYLSIEEFTALWGILEKLHALGLKLEPLRPAQGNNDPYRSHMRYLDSCDGLLLLWGCGQQEWFQKYLGQLKNAPAFRKDGRPLDSRIVLVKPRDATKTKFAKSLLPDGDLWEGVDLSKLAGFLIALTNRRRDVNAQLA